MLRKKNFKNTVHIQHYKIKTSAAQFSAVKVKMPSVSAAVTLDSKVWRGY